MKSKLLISIIAFIIGATAVNTAQAQTYDPYAVQVINNLIINNGLQATYNAPETWKFATWNNENPRQIIELQLNIPGGGVGYMNGVASFSGLTTLQILNCNWGYLTKIDLTNCTNLKNLHCRDNWLKELILNNCTQLRTLDCSQNRSLTKLNLIYCKQIQYLYCTANALIELDLIGFNKLTEFSGDSQSPPSLTLYQNDAGEYTLNIFLNNPTFTNSAVSYSEGILKSTDKNVAYTDFTVQTGKAGCELSGWMIFSYSDVGINPVDSVNFEIYPNPSSGELIIENGELIINKIEIFDTVGKIVSSNYQISLSSHQKIDISNLNSGIYFVKVTTERGEIVKKIVKQ